MKHTMRLNDIKRRYKNVWLVIYLVVLSACAKDTLLMKNLINEEAESFVISASIEDRKDSIFKLTLQNHTDDELKFFTSLFKRNYMNLVLVTDNSFGDILKEGVKFDNPPPGDITIRSGESFERGYNLSTHFPDLEKFRLKSDVLIYWSVKVKQKDISGYRRFGGYLHLPKLRRKTE